MVCLCMFQPSFKKATWISRSPTWCAPPNPLLQLIVAIQPYSTSITENKTINHPGFEDISGGHFAPEFSRFETLVFQDQILKYFTFPSWDFHTDLVRCFISVLGGAGGCSWDCYSVTTEFLNLHNVSLGYGAPLAYAEVQLSPLPHWVHPYCGISNPPKHHTTTSTMVSSRPTGPR